MTELASKTCVPCRGGVPPLKGEQLDALWRQVPEWEVVEEHHLRRHFRFKNFREALDFVNKVGSPSISGYQSASPLSREGRSTLRIQGHLYRTYWTRPKVLGA